MAASKLLPSFYAGDTLHIDVETKFNGQPENLEGATLIFTVKANETDTDDDALLFEEYIVPSGSEAQAGRASMKIDASKTKLITPGSVWFGLVRVLATIPPDVWTMVKEKNKVLQPIVENP